MQALPWEKGPACAWRLVHSEPLQLAMLTPQAVGITQVGITPLPAGAGTSLQGLQAEGSK